MAVQQDFSFDSYSIEIGPDTVMVNGCDCAALMDDPTALQVFVALGEYLEEKGLLRRSDTMCADGTCPDHAVHVEYGVEVALPTNNTTPPITVEPNVEPGEIPAAAVDLGQLIEEHNARRGEREQHGFDAHGVDGYEL